MRNYRKLAIAYFVKRILPCFLSVPMAIVLNGAMLSPMQADPGPPTDGNVNRPWVATRLATPDFAAEMDYIRERRRAADVDSKSIKALCFCGGGLRSATISLGILQGLEENSVLKNMDYLSGASGGMYMASWFVSHLLPPGHSPEKEAGSKQSDPAGYFSSRKALLQLPKSGVNEPGPVDKLRERRGFFFGKGNWRIAPFLGIWAIRTPFNLVFDVVLHYKPTRGKGNWYHMITYYQSAIERTYLKAPQRLVYGQEGFGRSAGGLKETFFKGKPHQITLAEINPTGSPAPYLVLGAALANAANDRERSTALLPFEFSRYAVGAPFLGYIPAKDFGFRVQGELSPEKNKRQIVLTANPFRIPYPFRTKPIKLSDAVAASGAAVDAAGLMQGIEPKVEEGPRAGAKSPFSKIKAAYYDYYLNLYNSTLKNPETGACVPLVATQRELFDGIMKFMNLNLRYQNRNFAVKPSKTPHNPWTLTDRLMDRNREVNADRTNPHIHSNSVYVSDGGHYDNLGVFAMLQRPQVDEIWSFDTGQDGDYSFGDLRRLRDLYRKTGWKCLEIDEFLARFDSLKPAARRERINKLEPVVVAKLEKGKRKVKLVYVKASFTPGDGDNMRQLYSSDKTIADLVKDYRGSSKSGTPSKFPHTSTANLSFTQGDFDSYRELGRMLAQYAVAGNSPKNKLPSTKPRNRR